MSTSYNNCQEFWDENPCNARHASRDQFARQYFADVRDKKLRAEPHLIPFMDLEEVAGKRILDVGCGLGTQAVLFALSKALVTATDLSPRSLALAREHADVCGVDHRVHCLQVDYAQKVPAVQYDIIWAWGTLHHMPQPRGVLSALRSSCAGRGTQLKVMLYHKNSTKAWWLRIRYGRRWREYTEAAEGCPISDAYTVKQARQLLEDSGWSVTRCRVTHIFHWNVAKYRENEWEPALPWNIVPSSWRHWLESIVGWHILLEAKPK